MKTLVAVLFTAALLFNSVAAHAERDYHRGDWERGRQRPGFGYVAHRLPPHYRTLHWRGSSYLYCDGLFYQYTPVGYMIVEPPVGVMVPELPPSYTTVVVSQMPYYVYGGTYYTPATNGFVVAEPPAAPSVINPSAPIPPKNTPADVKTVYIQDIDTYEIHIPNDNGSFTLVTIRKTAKGFVGPQGEIYPEHPTVDQLRERYAKK